jgi:hypothetical protein
MNDWKLVGVQSAREPGSVACRACAMSGTTAIGSCAAQDCVVPSMTMSSYGTLRTCLRRSGSSANGGLADVHPGADRGSAQRAKRSSVFDHLQYQRLRCRYGLRARSPRLADALLDRLGEGPAN